MIREPIYVIGRPKSGTTWTAQLLADALNCPLEGIRPTTNNFAAEGQNRPEPYVIRRGHCWLVDYESGSFIPGTHKMAWKLQKDEKIIFVIRDPRDMVVSNAHYWNRSIDEATDRIARGWQSYNTKFVNYPSLKNMIIVQYEKLHETPHLKLAEMVKHCGSRIDADTIKKVVERQSFEVRKKLAAPEVPENFYRKGVVGDWVNYLERDQCEKIETHCGLLMFQLGYTEDRDWWKEVDK